METPAIISMNWLLKVYRSHSHFLKPMEKLVEEPDNLLMTEIRLYYWKDWTYWRKIKTPMICSKHNVCYYYDLLNSYLHYLLWRCTGIHSNKFHVVHYACMSASHCCIGALWVVTAALFAWSSVVIAGENLHGYWRFSSQ
jgi:hypothetical protein